MKMCCGEEPYSVLDQTKLCCDGVLYEDDSGCLAEAECAGASIRYTKLDTQCESILYPLPGVFCCGHHSYNPVEDLCCAGHRWPQMRKMECCGFHYYDPMDRTRKCCSGRLHTLESGDEGRAQCCGTQLIIDASQVCCASSREQVLYRKESGFSCCGHFYYNSSQHSCCAGRLRPATAIQPMAAENLGNCVFKTLDNLKNHELCNEEVHIGFVESTAVKSGTRDIALKNVLRIHAGQNVTALRGIHLLHLNFCGCPSLVKDGLYLFIQQGAKMTAISDLSTSISPVYDILFRCTLPHLGNVIS